MKNLKLIVKLYIFCIVLLETVSSELQKHKAHYSKDYIIETEPQYNWFEAFHKCRDYNELAIIDSEEKNEAILDLLTNKTRHPPNLWLGGHDDFSSSNDPKRTFYWSATGTNFDYNYFSNAGFSENGAHCVYISNSTTDYRWHVTNCRTKMGFICEVKPGSV